MLAYTLYIGAYWLLAILVAAIIWLDYFEEA